MEKIQLSWKDIQDRARIVAIEIDGLFPYTRQIYAYPVPRGGIPAAQAVATACRIGMTRDIEILLVEKPYQADVFIDDIVDTGKTRSNFSEHKKPFFALVNKTLDKDNGWYVFPWERMSGEEAGPTENIRRLLEYIGEDPDREGLSETPNRVLESYDTLFGGYKQNVADVIKVFEDDSCDEMVVMRDIEFCSTCEHHMLPFVGKAHVAYVPNGRVIGASKLIRILEVYARRLQIQERLCEQVTQALMEHLQPKGAACVLEAKHLCISARGVSKQSPVMVTSSLTGVFMEKDNDARKEFLAMIR